MTNGFYVILLVLALLAFVTVTKKRTKAGFEFEDCDCCKSMVSKKTIRHFMLGNRCRAVCSRCVEKTESEGFKSI